MTRDITKRVRAAYNRGGYRQILKGIFRTGIRNIVPESYPISSSEVVESRGLDSMPETNRLWELPSEETKGMNRSQSGYPFKEEYEKSHFLQSCEYTYRPDFVCEINGSRLIGPNGIGITSSGSILVDSITIPQEFVRIEESIRHSFVRYPFLTLQALNKIQTRPRYLSSAPAYSLGSACLLHSTWNNYYHWIAEHLPKIRGVKYYESQTGNEPVLIIPDDPPTYVLDSLRVLNVDISNCIEWEPPAIDVDTLVLPGYPEANPENLHWLRKRIRAPITKNQRRSCDRIYISRKRAPTRRIKNEIQILEVLNEYEIDRLFAEDLSFTQQVKLFSNAELIVGPHGAGLTNIMWANDAKVIEIHNDYIRDHYCVLSNNLGHEYHPIQGQSTDADDINSDFRINPSKLRKCLSDMALSS